MTFIPKQNQLQTDRRMTTVTARSRDDSCQPDFADALAALCSPRNRRRRRPQHWQVAVALIVTGQATVAEVARLIGRSRQQVHEWCKGHPAIQIPWLSADGKQIRSLKGEPCTRDDIRGARKRHLERLWREAVRS